MGDTHPQWVRPDRGADGTRSFWLACQATFSRASGLTRRGGVGPPRGSALGLAATRPRNRLQTAARGLEDQSPVIGEVLCTELATGYGTQVPVATDASRLGSHGARMGLLAAVLDGSVRTTVGGTGLGLSIVEDVVEAHGWEIHVSESTAGGARFEITDVDRPAS